jgi:hypothetical protein
MRPVLVLVLVSCGARAKTPPPPHADVDRVLFAKDPPSDGSVDPGPNMRPDAPPILWDSVCERNPLARGCL